MTQEGRILHLQRLSTEDGPGIRTTVFLKGCLLSCTWCHNPESISSKPQIQRIETACIYCGSCMEACPQGCLSLKDGQICIQHADCDACARCVEACPTGAMEQLGKLVTVDTLTKELLKDRSFYETSQGGVTLSGGEPLLQSAFAAALMESLQKAGIHTALDTCGMAAEAHLMRVLPFADLVLFDLKLIDEKLHHRFTGQSNQMILKNLQLLFESLTRMGNPPRLWIRTPLIPGATDSRENLINIGRYLAETAPELVDRWEICTFNNLCRDKYRRLGMVWDYAETPLYTHEEREQRQSWALESLFPNEKIFVTGATAVADEIGGRT